VRPHLHRPGAEGRVRAPLQIDCQPTRVVFRRLPWHAACSSNVVRPNLTLMTLPSSIVIGARATVLAQVQARLVGDALLSRHPGLKVEYSFLSSPGDRELDTPLSDLLRRGGFTGDLGVALRSGSIDIAVHLWKDLPFATHPLTQIAATLPRADARDLLLVKRSWVSAHDRGDLRVLSSSARRRTNLSGFLQWALPGRAPCVTFVLARGDCEARLAQLMDGGAHALVVAKANIDRLLESTAPEFAAIRARVRAVLDDCEVMVLPLALNPTAPGQGALALEIRRDRADLAGLLATINDEATYGRVIAERARLAPTGDEDHPLGVSIVPVHCGEIEFTRGQQGGQWIQSAELRRHDTPLPPADDPRAVWTGDESGDDRYRRVALQVRHDHFADARVALFVARSEAWPDGFVARPGQVIWCAGIDTWRRLAARGIWVHGSDESLGDGGTAELKTLFPRVLRWVKFSHERGYDSPFSEKVATYRLERCAPLADLSGRTHFYWRSGAQFYDYLRANPEIRGAWHGCGPGNTFSMIRAAIGADHVRAFLSADGFRQEVEQ
jgi:hydroxymethylbilane synthase